MLIPSLLYVPAQVLLFFVDIVFVGFSFCIYGGGREREGEGQVVAMMQEVL